MTIICEKLKQRKSPCPCRAACSPVICRSGPVPGPADGAWRPVLRLFPLFWPCPCRRAEVVHLQILLSVSSLPRSAEATHAKLGWDANVGAFGGTGWGVQELAEIARPAHLQRAPLSAGKAVCMISRFHDSQPRASHSRDHQGQIILKITQFSFHSDHLMY